MNRPRNATLRALLAATLAVSMPVEAAETGSRPTQEPGAGPLLVATAARFNVKHPDDGPSGGGVEYRWAPLGRWNLIPGVGLTAAADGAVYAFGSLRYDFRLGSSWFLTPVFGAGAFRNGDDLDLGYGVQFKSGLELSFRVGDRGRIGLLVYHLSNASLSEDNPGTEVLELLFALPLGRR